MIELCKTYNCVLQMCMVDSSCLCLSIARDEETETSHKKVTFKLSKDEDSEGEDIVDIFGGKTPHSEKSESKSSFEKRQDKVIRFQISLICFATLRLNCRP